MIKEKQYIYQIINLIYQINIQKYGVDIKNLLENIYMLK